MKHSIFLVSILLLLAAGSCKKIKGCKDPLATNFDEKAKIDDESCTYEGEVSLWFNEFKSNDLIGLGITTLTVYFDDVSHGTIDPAVWAIGPECNGENTFTTSIDLGQVGSVFVNYVIRDQSGGGRFSGNILVTKNECKSKQLN